MLEPSELAPLPLLTRDAEGSADSRRFPSLKDMASEHIRAAIVSGEIRPGDKIAQDEVADELGISRLPVREAVIELTAKGYVTSVPRRGAYAVHLTVTDIVDHFEVLGAIFSLTARRAAEHMTDELLERLRKFHERILETKDPQQCQTLEIEFYRIVNRAGSSERLLATLQFLATALPNDFYLFPPGRRETEARYREKILATLEARDPIAAAEVTHEHLRTSARLTIESLEARGYWSDGGAEGRRQA